MMIWRCLGTADVLGYLSADRQAARSKVFVSFRVGQVLGTGHPLMRFAVAPSLGPLLTTSLYVMTADLQDQAYVNEAVLYMMALELNNAKCRLAFGDGTRQGHVVIVADDVASLSEQIVQVRAKWGLPPERPVVSCYEGGRDGFWLHRQLVALGIANQVVDAASIEVSRRAQRAKTVS